MDDDLDDNTRDRLVALARGAIASVPFVGGLIAEVIGSVIPKQRNDRVVQYLRVLAGRIEALEIENLGDAICSEGSSILIERGGLAAAESSSDEMVERIAEMVARGISTERRKSLKQERLLRVLRQLDDEQYLMLVEEAKFHIKDRSRWAKVKRPKFATYADSWDVVAEEELFKRGKEELVTLGLLEREIRTDDKGPMLNFSGKDFDYREYISRLGLLVLRETGYPDLERP